MINMFQNTSSRWLIIPLIFLVVVAGCGVGNSGENIDSVLYNGKKWSKGDLIGKISDSIGKESEKDAAIDTAGLYQSPVEVISANLYQKAYSQYRGIRLKYRNRSSKVISAIRFSWYGTNAFGEPADMGNPLIPGSGGGFTDNQLGPGKKETGAWEILSRDSKKVILAWPCEVVFADGSKWKCGR